GIVVASAIILSPKVGKELVPDDDQSEFSINVRLPKGTSYQRTEEFIKPIEKDIASLPHIERLFANVNSGFASFNLTLTPLESRKVSQQELMRQARATLRKYQGARISVSGGTDISGASSSRGGGPGGGGGGGANRLNILIQGPDIEQLQQYTVRLMDKVKTINGVVDVDTNFEPTQPELRVNIDRVRAADLGASIDSLASSLRTLVGGEEVSQYKDGDEQYQVVLRLDEPYRNASAMSQLLIPAGPGRTIQVSDVAELRSDY